MTALYLRECQFCSFHNHEQQCHDVRQRSRNQISMLHERYRVYCYMLHEAV